MRLTKQGLTAAAVLALISGGGVTVLTNNAMTRQIDQMAAEYGMKSPPLCCALLL